MTEVHSTVEHCPKCTGVTPYVMIKMSKSAVIQCRQCKSLHSGTAFPRKKNARDPYGKEE